MEKAFRYFWQTQCAQAAENARDPAEIVVASGEPDDRARPKIRCAGDRPILSDLQSVEAEHHLKGIKKRSSQFWISAERLNRSVVERGRCGIDGAGLEIRKEPLDIIVLIFKL